MSTTTLSPLILPGDPTTALGAATKQYVDASPGTGLLPANNLSDVAGVAQSRANLGLGTAATQASTAFATTAQGVKADNALPLSGGTLSGAANISGSFTGAARQVTWHNTSTLSDSVYGLGVSAGSGSGGSLTYFGSTYTGIGGYASSVELLCLDAGGVNITAYGGGVISFRYGTQRVSLASIDASGNATFSGAIGASNFSGASSGTNTGDQNLSGLMPVSGGTFSGSIAAPGIGTTSGFSCGSVTASGPTDFTKHLSLYGTNYGFSVTAYNLNYVTYNTHNFYVGSNSAVTINSAALSPSTNGGKTLGTSSLRWGQIYSTVSTISTSDARVKTAVAPLTTDEIAAAKDLAAEIGTYQFIASVVIKGDDARHHVGMTVQRAIEIMRRHGLDPMRYGFICYDQWEAIDEVAAGDQYSFRADQLLMFLARGFEARLTALEARP